MGDNSGFFFIVVVIVIVGMFFLVEPAELGNSGSSSTKTEQQSGSDNVTTKTIGKQLDDVEKKAEQIQKDIEQAKIDETRSPYYDKVYISSISHSSRGDANKEYMRLRTSSNLEGVINISGWKIRSTYTNTTVTIPQGANLYIPNNGSYISDILVSKSQTIYVNTGKSPISESFRLNVCSGYHEQFLDFTPSLSRSCPYPIEDINLSPSIENEPCLEYIDDLPRCTVQTEGVSYNFPSYCTEYINQKINYPSCVDFHKDDDDFFKNEWRIYLERGSTLWRNDRETILLLDENDKIVDTYTN